MPDYRKITNLIFEPKGIHDPTKTYTIKDTVTSSDRSKVYFAIKDVPTGIPLTNTNYWILQIDLSASKNAMDTAAANARTQTDATISSANARVEDMIDKAADAVTSVADYAAKVGMRVKGETKITKGNPMTIYPDGGSLLKVQTDIPIKQLGSGDPYPAGGGRNKLVPNVNYGIKNGIEFTRNADGSWTVKGTSTAGNVFFNLNYVNGTTSMLPPGEYIVSGGSADVRVQVIINDKISWQSSGNHVRFTIPNGVTNSWVRLQVDSAGVTVNAIVYPMVRLATDTDKLYAPPSNIRPIIGYDKLNLNRAGKNIIPYYNFLSDYSDGGVTVTINADKTLTFSGTATRDAYFYLSIYSSTYTTGYVFPPGEYALSGCPAGGGTQSYRMALSLYKDGVWQEGGCTDYGSGGRFTIPEGNKVDLYIRFPSGANANGVTFKPMIRLASIADDTYEPYQNTTYTVQLGQTVYCGRYDWLTGKLILTHKYVEYGGDTVFYSPNTGLINNGDIIRVTPLLNPVGVSEWSKQEIFSNLLPHIEGGWNNSSTSGPHIYILNDYPDTLVLLLPTLTYGTTEASVKAKFAETPLQVVYKLATPIEIQLAPNVITATEDSGMNYIYGDGDLTVEWIPPLSSINKRVESLLNEFSDEAEASGNPLVIKPIGSFPFDSIVTEFGPKQSGSGDPYPAGGGKNLAPIYADETKGGMTLTAYSDGSVSLTGTYTDSDAFSFRGEYETPLPPGTYTISVNNPEAITASGFWIAPYDDTSAIIKSILMSSANTVYTLTTEAPIKQIRIRGARDVALNNFVIKLQVEKGSVATEYAPPSNIRPITGYDALNLNRAGKNLAPVYANETKNGVALTANSDGSVSLTGTYTETSGFIGTYDVPLPPGTYTISANNPEPATVEGLFIAVYDETSTIIQAINMLTANRVYKLTTEKAIKYIRIRGPIGLTVDNFVIKLQVENGSVATEFEKSQSNLYSVQIGETAYGGRFNWLTGKLTMEYGFITLTGNEAYTYSAGKDLLLILQDAPEPIPGGVEAWCSHYKRSLSTTGVGISDYEFVVSHKSISGTPRLCIRDSVHFTDLSSAQAYIAAQHAAGTPVQVVYKLKTPIEIQLSTSYINTLSGTNTIYGDGDAITAKFRQSKYINILERLSALETLIINQTKGE